MAASLEEYMAKKYSGEKKRKKREEKVLREDAQTDKLVPTDSDAEAGASKKMKKSEELPDTSGRWVSVETNAEVSVPKKPDAAVSAKKKEGGLQSQEDIAAEIARKEERMRKELQGLKKLGDQMHTTVYRDASGRKLTDAEVRHDRENGKRVVDERDRKRRIEQLNRDEAGAAQKKRMQERLQQVKNEGINVYEKDENLVKAQKEAIKSEDPALLFDKGVIGKHEEELEKQFISITGRKLYKNVGQYPLNRFNTKPGWRWDGIVRGNGFEQKWHDAQVNKK
ncbi:hypothetical protein PMKS-004124 [Pichia membranifaciens]|uniref:Pre-mRNA-splicing factor CWC26 n=1 Tax=Pichia membranifaciens TaxID=4926 RepID=A0A1Q2YM06_9ASCO|nr:hypothetical protein PMKS-004124 [Pichia membranifaciens]